MEATDSRNLVDPRAQQVSQNRANKTASADIKIDRIYPNLLIRPVRKLFKPVIVSGATV
jgi:hypothetical protein